MFLVVLRVAIGWHFFYEGLWKYNHQDRFAIEAEAFLGAARGPLARDLNRLVPDIDGKRRLFRDLNIKQGPDGADAPVAESPLAKSWADLRDKFTAYYATNDAKQKDLSDQLMQETKKVFDRHIDGLTKWVDENKSKIVAHFAELGRWEEGAKTDPATAFQDQRRWDHLQELRQEAKGWLAELDARTAAFKKELLDLVPVDQAEVKKRVLLSNVAMDAWQIREKDRANRAKTAKGDAKTKIDEEAAKDPKPVVPIDFSGLSKNAAADPSGGPFGPVTWNRLQWMSFGLMCTLLSVGFCLMIGLFSRLAALVGAGFLAFVVIAQPSFPGVIPSDPPQLGHALIFNKDWVELLALLVLSTCCSGRWAGVDLFIHAIFVKPFRKENKNI